MSQDVSETGFIAKAARLAETGSIVCLFAIAVLVFAQLALRNLFSLAYASIDELARMAHIYLVFLLVPLVFLERSHVNIELVTMYAPEGVRRVLDIAITVLMALFSLIFLVSDYLFLAKSGNVPTPAMGMPNVFFFSGAYIGMALLFLAACQRLIGYARRRTLP
ncbi:MAG TPA: TRAP transporter small permease subunit [Candidatus Baltobacteraceae bacterium]|nr:TRAP transporter small permease subunit [Candidatus Baltobacteraceae bacterium]